MLDDPFMYPGLSLTVALHCVRDILSVRIKAEAGVRTMKSLILLNIFLKATLTMAFRFYLKLKSKNRTFMCHQVAESTEVSKHSL